jgi:hypothetical protein
MTNIIKEYGAPRTGFENQSYFAREIFINQNCKV